MFSAKIRGYNLLFRGSSTVEQFPVKEKVRGPNPRRGAKLLKAMKITYSYHAERKFLEEKYIQQLKITKKLIRKIILHPVLIDRTRGEKIIAIGTISDKHSLVVVYKEISENKIKTITFWPARKGRYESKIL